LRSRPFAWSGRRRIDGAIRCRQLRAITFRRTARRHLFSAEDANSSRFFGPRGAFTRPRRPLTFSWSLEGTPDQPLMPTDALSVTLRLQPFGCPYRATAIHLRAEGPRVAMPVRARRAKARERLPSYRDLASRNPQTEPARTFLIVNAFSRTVSPSLGSCPASGGAFELPSG
jgi:hypothetical protein